MQAARTPAAVPRGVDDRPGSEVAPGAAPNAPAAAAAAAALQDMRWALGVRRYADAERALDAVHAQREREGVAGPPRTAPAPRVATGEEGVRGVELGDATTTAVAAAAAMLRDVPHCDVLVMKHGAFSSFERMVARVGSPADILALRLVRLRRSGSTDWAAWADLARDLHRDALSGNAVHVASHAIHLLAAARDVPPAHQQACMRALYELKAAALAAHLPQDPQLAAAARDVAAAGRRRM